MDISAIRGKTVSAFICQVQCREFGRKFKIKCCDQFLFFGIRIDQSIALQLTKVPRGEDPSAEAPKRGGGRSDLSGREGGSGLLLVYASLINRAYLA